jgi:hypothetical protein
MAFFKEKKKKGEEGWGELGAKQPEKMLGWVGCELV